MRITGSVEDDGEMTLGGGAKAEDESFARCE